MTLNILCWCERMRKNTQLRCPMAMLCRTGLNKHKQTCCAAHSSQEGVWWWWHGSASDYDTSWHSFALSLSLSELRYHNLWTHLFPNLSEIHNACKTLVVISNGQCQKMLLRSHSDVCRSFVGMGGQWCLMKMSHACMNKQNTQVCTTLLWVQHHHHQMLNLVWHNKSFHLGLVHIPFRGKKMCVPQECLEELITGIGMWRGSETVY